MYNSFQVQGITCNHCEMAIQKAIARLDPEATIEIDRNTGKVNVHSKLPRQDIAQAITDEGYQII